MPAKSDSKHAKVRPSLEEGTLNPAPEKVQDPKFHDGEFFDPRDIVQVKYEMLRRVSVENASVTNATEEYGVSRPTYYQTKASFDEAGIAGLVPRKRGPQVPQAAGRGAGVYSRATGRGRAHSSAPAGQADPEEIRSRYPPKDDRASGRGKKNGALTPGEERVRSGQRRSGRNTKLFAMPRSAMLWRPRLAGASALSSSRHVGMGTGDGCAWSERAAGTEVSHIVKPPSDESTAVIHIFAAMAMNAEPRGATP